MYECPGCGAGLRYDIPSQKMQCDHCGNQYAITEVDENREKESRYETNVYICSQCGGEICTQDRDMISVCTYCGSKQVLHDRVDYVNRPKWIIPFRVTRDTCKQIYSRAVRNAWYAPKELMSPEYIEEIHGVYLPYWVKEYTYDKKVSLDLTDKSSYKVQGDMVTYHRYHLKASLRGEVVRIGHDASAWYSDSISEEMRPYSGGSSVQPFSPAYLCGFSGETADDAPDDTTQKELVREEEQVIQSARAFTGRQLSKYTVPKCYTQVNEPQQKKVRTILLPVWFLSYRKGNRVGYSVINGQNGRFYSELPVDMKKFMLSTAGMAVVLFLLLNLFWIMRPEVLVMAAAAAAAYALYYAVTDITEVARKELEITNPARAQYIHRPTQEEEASIGKYLWLVPVIALIVAENLGWTDRHPHGFFSWFPIVMTIICGITGIVNLRKLRGLVAMALDRKGYHLTIGPVLAFLSILLAIVVQILHPAWDYYYYGAGTVCLLMCIAALLSVVRGHNIMTTRKLPQFTHTGGDRNAN